MWKVIVILIGLLLGWDGVRGSSILAFFPMPVPSHHKAFQPLVRGLLQRGHSLTYFSPYGLDPPPLPPHNFTQILIKDFMPDMRRLMAAQMNMDPDKELKFHDLIFSQQIMIVMMKQYGYLMGELTMQDQRFQDLMGPDKEFDCILYGGTFMQEVFAFLAHRFRCPLIEVLPSGNFHYSYWQHGNPFDTSYIVDFTVAAGDRMSLMEKLENTFNSLLIRAIWPLYFSAKYQDLVDRLARYPGWEDRPPLQQLISNTSMVLMNTHYSLNYPYPLAPNFKEIGGINIVPSKPLSKDLQDFMDSAPEGVVYFSLGSHINVSYALDGGLLQAFVKTFAQIPQRVLWKSDQDIPDLSPNVRLGRWFPQQSILGHSNCKAFITHGGFLSLSETVYHGVPTVAVPLLADQMKNARHMELNRYGVYLKLTNVTETSLLWALGQTINSSMYRENIKKRSELFRDKPETALETAVYWTEYVIRHKGAPHLKPSVATMPWYQQAMIDVYTAIALILLIPLYLAYKITKCVCCCLCKTKSKIKTKRE